jgi:hypothetical protein
MAILMVLEDIPKPSRRSQSPAMAGRSRWSSVRTSCGADPTNEMLRAAAESPRPAGGISVEYAEELVAAIRADRDAE